MSEEEAVEKKTDWTPAVIGLGWCLAFLGLGGCVYLCEINSPEKPLFNIEFAQPAK